MKKSELKQIVKEVLNEGVLQDAKSFTEDMKSGFIAYQLGGEGKWRYSEFNTPENYPDKRAMITFKGNGYGHIYADAMAHKPKFYKVLPTLEKAEEYARIQNGVIAGRKEDEKLIYGRRNRW